MRLMLGTVTQVVHVTVVTVFVRKVWPTARQITIVSFVSHLASGGENLVGSSLCAANHGLLHSVGVIEARVIGGNLARV